MRACGSARISISSCGSCRRGRDFRVYPSALYYYRKHATSTSHRLNEAVLIALKAANLRFLERVCAEPLARAAAGVERPLDRDGLAYEKLLRALKDRNWGTALDIAVGKPSAVALFETPDRCASFAPPGSCLQECAQDGHARAIFPSSFRHGIARNRSRSADDAMRKMRKISDPRNAARAAFAAGVPALACLFVVAILSMGLSLIAKAAELHASGPPLDRNGLVKTFDDEFTKFSWFAEGVPNTQASRGTWRTNFGYAGVQQIGSRTLASNGEKQIYVDQGFRGTAEKPLGIDPFHIADGALEIVADKAARGGRAQYLELPLHLGPDHHAALVLAGLRRLRNQGAHAEGAWLVASLLAPARRPFMAARDRCARDPGPRNDSARIQTRTARRAGNTPTRRPSCRYRIHPPPFTPIRSIGRRTRSNGISMGSKWRELLRPGTCTNRCTSWPIWQSAGIGLVVPMPRRNSPPPSPSNGFAPGAAMARERAYLFAEHRDLKVLRYRRGWG